MRKNLYLIAVVLGSILILGGCQQEIIGGSGSSSSGSSTDVNINVNIGGNSNRDRTLVHEIFDDLNAFDSLNVHGVFDIVYRQSTEHRVELHIEQHILDQTDVEVNGNTLRINQPVRLVSGIEVAARVYIYAPTLVDINLNGVIGASGWDELHVDHLVLDIDGVTSFEIAGSARSAEFSVDGVSSVSSLSFQTDSMTLDVRGVSDVAVAVANDFDVSIRGVNTVRYRGNPTINERHVDLISSLQQVN